jgi:hypothetical protein
LINDITDLIRQRFYEPVFLLARHSFSEGRPLANPAAFTKSN